MSENQLVDETSTEKQGKKKRYRRSDEEISQDLIRMKCLHNKGLSDIALRLILGRKGKKFEDDLGRLKYFKYDKEPIRRKIVSSTETIESYELEGTADFYEVFSLYEDGKIVLKLVPMTKEDLLN